MLTSIAVPQSCNYIGVFLTLDCNLSCSYCINRLGEFSVGRHLLSGAEWAEGLNRIVSRPDLPLTLQGGEPTLHPDFFAVIAGIRHGLNIDLLTNLATDLDFFMMHIPPERIKRTAPYASIRVSYHPETMSIDSLAAGVKRLLTAGYSVGVWAVLHPEWEDEIILAQKYCLAEGIDFRTKEFLGIHNGRMYGRLSYPDACDGVLHPEVACRTTELLIDPAGDIYRCHADLYAGRFPVGNILEPALLIDTGFRRCSSFGRCNPCDVKLKTDRFQQFGHTSVEIRSAGASEWLE